jgi:hypothetical protein
MAQRTEDQVSGWVGWIAFAGIMMILEGAFQFILGLTALFNQAWLVSTASGHALLVGNYPAWGWTHIILGVLIAIVGMSLFSGSTVGRVFGVILVALSAISNLAFLTVTPLWSIVIITVDMLIIYALVVHGGELRESSSSY